MGFEKHLEITAIASGPEIRMTAIAPMPLAVALAQIVSIAEFMAQSYELKTLLE